jgi:hypothetical protein
LGHHDVGGGHVTISGIDTKNFVRRWPWLWLEKVIVAARDIADGCNSGATWGATFGILLGAGEVDRLGIPREGRRHFDARESVHFVLCWEPGVKVTDDSVGRHKDVKVRRGNMDSVERRRIISSWDFFHSEAKVSQLIGANE